MSGNNNCEVTVIIPHYNGEKILSDCLLSLRKNVTIDIKILLVDNCSSDDSVAIVKEDYPEVDILELEENRGFAGGCNAGMQAADTPFILILNNDTVHKKGWIASLLEKIKSEETIAAVQPKLLSYQNKGKFDYSGAAGGEIDIFGYPFARGRIFDYIEEDHGQYQKMDENIFWASGTAFLTRRKLMEESGGFDENFFAHMEEIDMHWRYHLMDYKVVIEPEAAIWHRSGYTLGAESFLKKYLNHRNNLFMFLSNYKLFTTCYLLPIRLLLEWTNIFASLVKGDLDRVKAIFKAHFWLIKNAKKIINKRKKVKSLRQINDFDVIKKMYKGSVALQHYLFAKNKLSEL